VQIEGEFEDLDLPYKVDLINFNKCQKSFQNSIKDEMILFENDR
jgi:hypothetical protein